MDASSLRRMALGHRVITGGGTFSMAADTRGQFHEWSKEQYVVRNSRCPLKLLPNNAPTLTRELSALSTSQTSRNEKVPRREPCAHPIVSSTATKSTASPPSTCKPI